MKHLSVMTKSKVKILDHVKYGYVLPAGDIMKRSNKAVDALVCQQCRLCFRSLLVGGSMFNQQSKSFGATSFGQPAGEL